MFIVKNTKYRRSSIGRATNEELENISDAKIIKRPRRHVLKLRFTPKNNGKSLRGFLVGVVHNYTCILVSQIFKIYFLPLFMYSLNKYLLVVYHVPDTRCLRYSVK